MRHIISAALLVVLAGCASGPSIDEVAADQARISDGNGRLVVYRTSIMGTAHQPEVSVDGVQVGKCVARGAIIADMRPGQKIIRMMGAESLVSVAAGETSYVRCGLSMGVFVPSGTLEPVPANVGKAESGGLSLLK